MRRSARTVDGGGTNAGRCGAGIEQRGDDVGEVTEFGLRGKRAGCMQRSRDGCCFALGV